MNNLVETDSLRSVLADLSSRMLELASINQKDSIEYRELSDEWQVIADMIIEEDGDA